MKAAKRSDWQTDALPDKRTTIGLDRVFSPDEASQIRMGLIPEQMEDKWFIYWEDDALYFHRSWTGHCIYVVHFAHDADNWRMVQAEVNRDPEQYRMFDDEAQMISSLVDALLLHRPYLAPDAGPASPHQALADWSQIGRASIGQHPDGDEPEETDAPRGDA